MELTEAALEARVRQLLWHLEEMPAVEAALPFTVAYLIAQLRDAVSDLSTRRMGTRLCVH